MLNKTRDQVSVRDAFSAFGTVQQRGTFEFYGQRFDLQRVAGSVPKLAAAVVTS